MTTQTLTTRGRTDRSGATRATRRAEQARARARQRDLVLGGGRGPRVAAVTILVVLASLWLLPMLWGLITSFKAEQDAVALPLTLLPESGFTLDQYRGLFAAGNVQQWMFNSLLVAVLVTVSTLAVAAPAAFAMSRMDFRGRSALMILTIAAIVVPPQLLIVPLFQQMVSLNLVDTYAAVILPQLVMPIIVFILKRFFDAVPRELDEAARIDGASYWRLFTTVILPLSRPILAAAAIFVFISAWNNYLWPFIITTDPALMTLPVGIPNILDSYGTFYAAQLASSMVAAAPMIVVFVLFQRHIVRSVATTGITGQ
ncbi:carbohydrate ABC transporter membrane protein 2 (CUT1 family) [Nocardiopsis sp. Huas11]|uniref:carbohydrate ABC transporter permease n=1 Tax=Nocardiopsis sp. Huas11 TaxID=2183912 RepID=UPI000EB46441|nr:carbohydrate ABC transporter permease [Nocardiopsis sp. Huas11]RKS08111.1 carbohydrate ABC transporter membrane protein 2 (CUT1 family) [Nocardiopsis sp. Huas11]